MAPHLICLIEMVQMRGHNIRLHAELTKILPNYHHLLSRAFNTYGNAMDCPLDSTYIQCYFISQEHIKILSVEYACMRHT